MAVQKALRQFPIQVTLQCRRDTTKPLLQISYSGLLLYSYEEVGTQPSYAIIKSLIQHANSLQKPKFSLANPERVSLASQMFGGVKQRLVGKTADKLTLDQSMQPLGKILSTPKTSIKKGFKNNSLPALTPKKQNINEVRNVLHYSQDDFQSPEKKEIQDVKTQQKTLLPQLNSGRYQHQKAQRLLRNGKPDLRLQAQRRHELINRARAKRQEEQKQRLKETIGAESLQKLQELKLKLRELYLQIIDSRHSNLSRDCCQKVLELVEQNPKKAVSEVRLLLGSTMIAPQLKQVLLAIKSSLLGLIQSEEEQEPEPSVRTMEIMEIEEGSESEEQEQSPERSPAQIRSAEWEMPGLTVSSSRTWQILRKYHPHKLDRLKRAYGLKPAAKQK